MTDAMYIAAILALLVFVAVALILDLRKSEQKEKEIIDRLDKHMEAKDDVNWPANFIP